MGLRATLRAVAATVAVALTVGGCGSATDEQQIRDLVADVQTAFAEGQVTGVCDMLTRAARTHIESIGHESTRICAREMREFLRGVRAAPGYHPHRPSPEIVEVEVMGDRALATMAVGAGRLLDVPFRRVGDRWRVNGLYGGIPAERQKDEI